MSEKVRVSLANKCQLLFGGAVLLILTAALAVVWVRMEKLVLEGQEHAARQVADSHLNDMVFRMEHSVDSAEFQRELDNGTRLRLIRRDEFETAAEKDPFVADALRYFRGRFDRKHLADAEDAESERFYTYARAIRLRALRKLREEMGLSKFGKIEIEDTGALSAPVPGLYEWFPGIPSSPWSALEALRAADRHPQSLEMVLLVRQPAREAEKQLMLNRISIVAAGLVAGLLAIAVFWFITTRLILSPVRVLRNYAEKVSEGDLNIRSDINTGDEFEQLSDMFNTMLESIKSQADQLRATNKSLDLKLGELAETNVTLYEANKIKGEFLANVSHELRTPLNSIIGFAEVLRDTVPAGGDDPVEDEKRTKRIRYLNNIIQSSRQLLDLINDLLDLAKIEAGRMEVRSSPMSVGDTVEGLINLIRPQAEPHGIDLRLDAPPNLPIVQTDPGKVQQVLFNFLSNAVKFTPDGGVVTMAAEVIEPKPNGNGGTPVPQWVRISVTDTGPGIAPEHQDRIFDKFTQLDPSVTREHDGTGLGLTISRDLARLLGGRLELQSKAGEGATFSLIIPMAMQQRTESLMPDLASTDG